MANSFKVKMPNKDGSEYALEKTNYIKYLGVLIDDTISWKYHISFIRSRLSRNTGIFLKLIKALYSSKATQTIIL